MNVLDGITAAYAAATAIRGARRGGAEESYRLLRLAVSLLAGCGLFALVSKGAEAALAATGTGAGALGFAAGLGLVYYATRKLKTAAVSFLRRLVAEKYSRLTGAGAGFLRAVTAVSALVAFLQMSPWIPGVTSALDSSLIGRIVGSVARPGQENVVSPGEGGDNKE